MPRKFTTRASQRLQVAEFIFGFADTIMNANGTVKDLGATTVGADGIIADVIHLPPGSVVVGGDVTTDEAFTGAFSVTVGDALVPARYLGASARGGLGRTPLVPTGYKNVDGLPIRLTATNAGVNTTGKMTVRVEFLTTGREEDVAL
jgi:hypothetical protein